MQHQDVPKKKGKGRPAKSFWENATASLRLMQKTAPDDSSQLYLVAAAVASTVSDTVSEYASSIFYKKPVVAPAAAPPLPKPKIDVEEDSRYLCAEFAKYEMEIAALQAERKQITKDIKAYKLKQKNSQVKIEDDEDIDEEDDDSIAVAQPAATVNAAAPFDPKAAAARRIEILKAIEEPLIKKIQLIPENIREHARRRVDLFFLLCIAVYNKKVVISKGDTIYQHGIATEATGTAACHSSLIPNPVVTLPPPPKEEEPTGIIKAAYWVAGLFKTATPPGATTVAAAPAEPEFKIAGTYLDDLLNMTTMLPTVVNDFDGQMEGKYEQSIDVYLAIDIVNKVAKGELNPINGLNEFFKYMREFFTDMDRRYFRRIAYSNSRMILYPRATKLVWQYEMEGTFSAYNAKKQAVDADYIYLMLGLPALTKLEKMNYYLNPFNSVCETRILAMQKEILESKSNATAEKPIKREKKPGNL